MKEKNLRKYLIEERNDCFQISGYWFPKNVSSGGRLMDIEKFRKSQLKFTSEYEEEFIKVMRGTWEEKLYIPEFPIPVFDRTLWREICQKEGITRPETLNKSLLSLDFFFPYRSLVIEIDGAQHWENDAQKKDDVVRDEYLRKKYSMSIHRLPQFTRDHLWKLKKVGEDCVCEDRPMKLKGWEKDLIENWKLLNSEDIKCLDHIEKTLRPRKEDGVIVPPRHVIDRVFMRRITKEEKKRLELIFLKLWEKKLRIP